MNSSSGDDEAPKDPRTGGEDFTQQFTENDFEWWVELHFLKPHYLMLTEKW